MSFFSELLKWLPLLVTFLTLFGGVFVYNLQKSIDRRNKAKEERRQLYRDVIGSAFQVEFLLKEAGTSPEVRKQAIVSFFRDLGALMVAAPDSVVKAMNPFEKELSIFLTALQNGEVADRSNYEIAAQSLIFAMRQDTFEETKITREALTEITAEMKSPFFSLKFNRKPKL